MSSFNCEHCGAPCLDSSNGYTTGCEHYPPDIKKVTHPIMRDFNGNPIKVSDSGKWMPKIKPLVFEERGNESKYYVAETVVGKFWYMRRSIGKWNAWFTAEDIDDPNDHSGALDTKEEAIAFVQAEYERRVRSCLV